MRDYSNLDGEVIDYEIASATQNITTNPYEEDNFYPADGEDMSYGIGDFIAKQKEKASDRREKRAEKKDERQEAKTERKDIRQTKRIDRNERKNTRADAKGIQAQSQLEIAKSLSLPDATATALAGLSSGTKDTNEGMSMGMKIGIAVLVLGVVGFIGYKVYKAKKK